MALLPNGHLDILAELRENIRSNNEDPSWYDRKEEERNSQAKPYPMDTPIPKPPPLNEDGSEKQETDTSEAWLVVPEELLDLVEGEFADLLEKKTVGMGFTGVITDKLKRKIHFVNGKRVKGSENTGSPKGETHRARLNGEKIHVISHDPDNGLVSVQGGDGQVKVVKTDDLDFDRGKGPDKEGGKKEKDEPEKTPAEYVAKTSGPIYNPNPAEVNPKTGLADRARVGVPADSLPPPPEEIGRLPNLNESQRRAESRFADDFLKDPEKLVDGYLKAIRKRKVGEYPNVFAPDDVKMLDPDWNPAGAGNLGKKLPEDVKAAMAANNAAVHQTADAIAKRAFAKYLADVVAKYPEGVPRRCVLALNGSCAAGKGSSLKHSNDPDDPHYGMLPAAEQVGAIWDSAGEQCGTENEFVLSECRKNKVKAIFTFVWADPDAAWSGDDSRGVLRRAMRKGRMVGPRVFADSCEFGAKNNHAFWEKHKDDEDCEFIFLDNRSKAAPKLLDSFPTEALKYNAEDIYRHAVAELQAKKDTLDPVLYEAGMGDLKIWGPPK